MNTEGAFAIILNEKNRVLLVKRKDFPIWDLPGGRLDPNESDDACAIREAQEETGYIVKINRKIGEYQRPQSQDTQHVYLAEIIGGQAIVEGLETRKLKFFPLKMLPLLMVPHRKMQIQDYRQGKERIVKVIQENKRTLKILNKLKH